MDMDRTGAPRVGSIEPVMPSCEKLMSDRRRSRNSPGRPRPRRRSRRPRPFVAPLPQNRPFDGAWRRTDGAWPQHGADSDSRARSVRICPRGRGRPGRRGDRGLDPWAVAIHITTGAGLMGAGTKVFPAWTEADWRKAAEAALK